MPVNVSPDYVKEEKGYVESMNDEDRIYFLERMMKTMPGHKGAEAMRANLRTRYKKLKEKIAAVKKTKSSSGGKQNIIKKEDMQCVLAGFPNTGKSSLFKLLTGKETLISDLPFSTAIPEVAMMQYEDVKMQVIDSPPFPNEDKSLINTADTLLILLENLSQLEETKKLLPRAVGKRIYLVTKTDLLSEPEKRKLEANIKSKYKHDTIISFSTFEHSPQELNELKKRIFKTFPIIRIYLKEPKKEPGKIPMILRENATVANAADKILKGMSKKIKKTNIWGPSSKFPGQLVGLEHKLKDKDVVEFQTI